MIDRFKRITLIEEVQHLKISSRRFLSLAPSFPFSFIFIFFFPLSPPLSLLHIQTISKYFFLTKFFLLLFSTFQKVKIGIYFKKVSNLNIEFHYGIGQFYVVQFPILLNTTFLRSN